jgi:uncharacterized protein YfdQ (DUF2303 family)
MTDNDNAAEVIRDLAQAADAPRELHPGSFYTVVTPAGFQKIDLTGDEYRDFPKRKAGRVTVQDVASFAHYYGKHSDGGSEVFADLDQATITAVLDAHGVTGDGSQAARWQQHRLILGLQQTQPWKTWTAASGNFMKQQDFADFLESNAEDVAPDGPVSAADLLEIAQKFHMTTNTEFQSGQRLADGQTHLVYIEKSEAKAGQRGELKIPSTFELGIVPYEDCAPRRVTARFRYRANGGNLALGFVLDDPARIARAAVREIVAKAAEETGAVIMTGRPSGS